MIWVLDKAISTEYKLQIIPQYIPSTPFSCKILTSASVDGCGAEGFPDDGFTDVGGNEERDSRAQTVALL